MLDVEGPETGFAIAGAAPCHCLPWSPTFSKFTLTSKTRFSSRTFSRVKSPLLVLPALGSRFASRIRASSVCRYIGDQRKVSFRNVGMVIANLAVVIALQEPSNEHNGFVDGHIYVVDGLTLAWTTKLTSIWWMLRRRESCREGVCTYLTIMHHSNCIQSWTSVQSQS